MNQDLLDQNRQSHPLLQKTDELMKQMGHVNSAPLHIEKELANLRQDFEQYCSKQAADKATEGKRHELAEKRQFWCGALAGAIGSTAANLFIFYWPNIIAAIGKIFH